MQLSTHFTLEEMTRSDTAEKYMIDNTLSIKNDKQAALITNLQRVCDSILEPVRVHYDVPITPSSGYRCPKLNSIVRGSPASQHTRGEAVDFEVGGVSNLELAHWVKDNIPDFDQLILERYDPKDPEGGWVHVSISGSAPRKEVRTMGRTVSATSLPTLPTSDIQVADPSSAQNERIAVMKFNLPKIKLNLSKKTITALIAAVLTVLGIAVSEDTQDAIFDIITIEEAIE